MITLATIDDLAAVADIAAWYFHRSSPIGEFDREVWCSTWNKLLASNAGLVLKRQGQDGPTEAIGVMLYPSPNDGKLSAYAAFWYIVEDAKALEGGLLHLELEKLLKERGLARLYMTSLVNQREGKVTKYLLHAGYTPIEVVWGKEFT